jgi:hypothetical protein
LLFAIIVLLELTRAAAKEECRYSCAISDGEGAVLSTRNLWRGFAMIDDVASLKRAMEQMDAEDVAVAKAAKDRAAQILRDAGLNFSKIAELMEQRRLLVPPKIVAGIKRMDQPDMPGDTAFRDTASALRSEGQSFRQIAEAVELSDNSASKYEDPVEKSEPLHQMVMEGEPDAPALPLVARIISFPLRRPTRFLVTAVLAFWLVNAFRFPGYLASIGAQADAAIASVSSFFDKRQSQQAAAPPTPPSTIPSPSAPSPSAPSPPSATPSVGPATSAPPATAPAPSASDTGPPAPPPAAPAGPPAPTPRLDARGAPPSKSAAKDHPRVQPRALEHAMPDEIRRNSRIAGPCVGGVGGCYWGGDQF